MCSKFKLWESKLLQSKAVESAPASGTERLYAAYKNQQAAHLQKKEPQLQPQQQTIAAAQVTQQPHEIKPAIVQAHSQVQLHQPTGKKATKIL